jgi:signal transduction histidine kinase
MIPIGVVRRRISEDYTDTPPRAEFGTGGANDQRVRSMRLGIRYRLLLPLGLLLVGVVAASLWSARVAARRAEGRVAGQVRNVADTLQKANFKLNPTILFQMRSLSGAEFLYAPPDGLPVTTFEAADVHVPPPEAFEQAAEAGLGPVARVQDRDYRCRRVVIHGPSPNAGAVVYIFYPESLLEEAITDAQRPSYLGLAFGLLAVGLTFGIAQRLVGRVRALERRTRQIAGGDFSPMPVPRANDELRDLTVSVNEMAERLARLRQAVQTTERLRLTGQLASGLAHQLRNSVTGAKLAVQVYLAEHADADTEALSVTLRQLALTETNLRRFIDLGRPGEGNRRECSLVALLTDVVELHRPRAKHAGIDLRWERPAGDVKVEGDAGQLADLFANLLGNALDAAGPCGEVCVSLRRAGPLAVAEVGDTGPGPPADVAARLFEPFVTGKPEGIGLGLAVARRAAEAHGGTITWRRASGRTVFRVELPAAPAPVGAGVPPPGAG